MATLATIRTYAALRADQDVGNYPTTAQDLTLINAAGQDVWLRLLSGGWPINFQSVTITSTAGKVALGVGNIVGVHGVYYVQGTQFYRIRRLNEGHRAQLMDPNGTPGWSEYYSLSIDPTSGPVIELLPATPGGQYRIDYVPEWPGFAIDTDVWYGPAGSDELVALRAASKMLRKEGSREEASDIDKEFEVLLMSVIDRAKLYDMRNPAQIRDENSMAPRFTFDFPVAGPSGGWGFGG